jgi:AcrR family transcriptional regulator
MASVDGRVERGNRSREAIVAALLGLYEAGNLTPSVPEVAARAGVSVRSVHYHFTDFEALRADAIKHQLSRLAPLVQRPVTNIAELAAQRSEFWELVTPVRRAALLQVHESPTIARAWAKGDRCTRRQLELLFPGRDPDVISALDMVTSWDAWNRLRTQGCSVERARHILEQAIRSVVEGNTQ